ncbi:MAG: hemin-binding protein [Prevotella sp.]|nr:hemin-binding protein [Prevotella sp.]
MNRIVALLSFFFVCVGMNHAQTQQWWGYMGNSTSGNSVGIGVSDTYHCAMFLPGNHDVTSGKTLNAVRITLKAPHAANVKVWTAATLPTVDPSPANTLWLAPVADEQLGGTFDVALPAPYAIPVEGIFVGYTFTITSASTNDDQYPVATAGTDQPMGLFLRTNNNIAEWQDLNGNNFGVLSMKVLLEGTFADYMVAPTILQNVYYAQINESVDVDAVIVNNGQATVNSVSYTLSSNGVAGEEKTLNFSTSLATYESGRITIKVDADAVASSSVRTLTITKVNGEANQSVNASAQFTLNSMDRLIKRNVVVEEFTGTGCGWCPRGLVGMDKLRQTFGDRFVGIGIHQYNENDAMYIANYPYLNFGGAPSCRVNRGPVIDPYFGSSGDICDDFRLELSKPTMVNVSVAGLLNEAITEVEATAVVEPLFDTSDYTLELALVADGLSGTTSAWMQSNYYSGQSASSVPDDLRQFCPGGRYSSNSVKGYVFNDVAVGTSYRNGVNQLQPLGAMTGGEKRTVTYTLSLPTKATLRNALKKGTIYVVALVIDKDGTIANAAKREVRDTDGIIAASTDAHAAGNASYSLNGMQLTTPQRGINIIRMADGTVRKVVVGKK